MKQQPIRIPYSNTTIPPEKTQAEITTLLKKHGVSGIQWTDYQGETILRFMWRVTVKGVEKEIMFQFKPPVIPSKKRSWTGLRYEKINVNLDATAYRLLWHYLTNKLEAVRWGLESMEKEFLSHAVVALPDGKVTTVGENVNAVFEAVRSPQLTYQENERKVIDVGKVET